MRAFSRAALSFSVATSFTSADESRYVALLPLVGTELL
jgi:hypothetical protein